MSRLNLYNEWGCIIRNNRKFADLLNVMIERQQIDNDVNNGVWHRHLHIKPYTNETLKSHRTKVVKIVYAHMDDDQINRRANVDFFEIFQNLINQKQMIDHNLLALRLVEGSNMCKKGIVNILAFYRKAMNLKDRIQIPRNVKLPKDKKLQEKNLRMKNIVIQEYIDRMYDLIRTQLYTALQKNDHIRQCVVRGALTILIILATGLRIKESRQITIDNLIELQQNKQIKINIKLKKKTSEFAFISVVPGHEKYVTLALQIMNINRDVLKTVSINSSTKHHDIQEFAKYAKLFDFEIESNIFRHFVASNMYNQGYSVQQIAAIMNHENPRTTMSYINKKYHRGPILYSKLIK